MDDVKTGRGLGACSYETGLVSARRVTPDMIDELGHVNNLVYLRWVQEVAVEHWNLVAPEAMRRSAFFVVLRHEIDYRDALLVEDVVEIRTWLGKAHGPRFDRHVDIRREGASKFSALACTTWCMVNAQTKRPLQVGTEALEAFGLREADHR